MHTYIPTKPHLYYNYAHSSNPTIWAIQQTFQESFLLLRRCFFTFRHATSCMRILRYHWDEMSCIQSRAVLHFSPTFFTIPMWSRCCLCAVAVLFNLFWDILCKMTSTWTMLSAYGQDISLDKWQKNEIQKSRYKTC